MVKLEIRIECGRSGNATFETISSFIEREHETGEKIFPWHVAIFKQFGTTTNFIYTCGGTLVNPENKGFFILTAAVRPTYHTCTILASNSHILF